MRGDRRDPGSIAHARTPRERREEERGHAEERDAVDHEIEEQRPLEQRHPVEGALIAAPLVPGRDDNDTPERQREPLPAWAPGATTAPAAHRSAVAAGITISP